MSALPNTKSSQLDTRSLSGVFHLAVVLVLSALPAAAATAFPPSVLEDKNETFIALYLVTLPWSLAVTAIVAGFADGWFGRDERTQVLAVVGILLASAVIGGAIAPGSPLDEHFRGGPPWVVVSFVIVFALIGYALMYGWPMWFASFFVAAYVGWWVHERSRRADVAGVASGAGMTSRIEEPSRSAGTAGVARAVETSNLSPRLTKESPRRPRYDEFAGLTKAELYERAREVGIKGRSAMSKDQLLASLRRNR